MKLQLPRSRVVEFDGFLLALLIASLGGNIHLAMARNQVVAGPPNQPQLIAAGSKAPVFKGRDLKGAPVSLAYDASKAGTLLYIFSSSCHWCERNRANIEAIAKARPDLRIVGVAVSGNAEDLSAPNPFHVTIRPTPDTVKAYGFAGTPATVLVSPDGRIVSAWSGAYAGRLAAEVSKVLAVTLPGLMQESVMTSGTIPLTSIQGVRNE